MKKRWVFVLMLCLYSGVFALGQTPIKGRVVEENESPVPFANICLFSATDSTRLLLSSMSDLQGRFEFSALREGSYWVRVSALGFKLYKEPVTLSSTQKEQALSIQLQAEAQQLHEVEVAGRAVRVSADKVVYAIGIADTRGKTQALELIDRIPKLSLDPIEQKIKSYDGKAVKILVNGMNASENTLRTIHPDQIIRLEHYDIPPARFAQFGSVLNIITKTAEQGWEAGVDLAHAFTTGFGNDMAYLKFSSSRAQWSLDYNLNHRNYSDRVQRNEQEYVFESVQYERQESRKSAFGYDDHQINLAYVYQDSNQRSVQIKFSPNYLSMHDKSLSEIVFAVNDSSSNRNGNHQHNSNVFNPVLDVYLSKSYKDGQEFIFNVVGTAFSTQNTYLNKEENAQQEILLRDFMHEKNRKYSLISEAVYSKKTEHGEWDLGYQLEANRLTSAIENTFETSDYTTRYQQHYAYTQWTGKWKNLLINGQLGLAFRASSSALESYDAWIFRPMLMLGYEWNEMHSLRWVSKRENHEPEIAQWSSNRVYETDHIIRQGNPYLRHSIENETYLDYTFRWGRMSLELIPYFSYMQSPINSYYTLQQQAIVYAAENGDYQKTYGLEYVVQCKPFNNNWLQITAYGKYMRTELSSSFIGKYQDWNHPLSYRILSSLNNFSVYYMGKILGQSLDGPYLVRDENAQHIGFKYVQGSWSLSCQAYWLGTASKYYMRTIAQSYVQKELNTRIKDNANMLVLGISYTWEKGKAYKQAQKLLHHRDSDAGVFR